jgi:peroxiredoxin Q/BCP
MEMKHILIPIIIVSIIHSLLAAESLKIGDPAPQLQAVDQTGTTIDLGAALSKGTAVVFFYPKAMTPGCTKQACSLRDAWSELNQRGVKLFGVSADSPERQQAFIEKYQLPYTLIADTDQAVCKAFKKSRWSRQAYLFQDGKLVWLDLKASTASQADDVLAALDALAPSS